MQQFLELSLNWSDFPWTGKNSSFDIISLEIHVYQFKNHTINKKLKYDITGFLRGGGGVLFCKILQYRLKHNNFSRKKRFFFILIVIISENAKNEIAKQKCCYFCTQYPKICNFINNWSNGTFFIICILLYLLHVFPQCFGFFQIYTSFKQYMYLYQYFVVKWLMASWCSWCYIVIYCYEVSYVEYCTHRSYHGTFMQQST